jgi:hypothetical protein
MATPAPWPEPMEVGSACLPEAEHRRRRNLGLCSYCGERGHFSLTWPLSTNRRGGDKPGNSTAPAKLGCKISLPFLSIQPVCFPIKFPEYPSPSLLLALIYSRAAGNLLDNAVAPALRKSFRSPTVTHSGPIGTGLEHHITISVSLLTHDTHL